MTKLTLMTGTEAAFFKRGRQLAKAADQGEPLPEERILSFPPCQNSCRLDRKLNQGATRKRDGTIRRSVQEQSGGTDVAAGEREDG